MSAPAPMRTSFLEVREHLSELGFHWEHGWTEAAALQLARHLGRPTGDFGDSRVVRPIAPQRSQDARPNTLSQRYGLGAFPFHTETAYWWRPARYVLLYCVSPGSSGRPTLLLDCHQWRLRAVLRRQVVNAVFRVKGRRAFLAPVGMETAGGLSWRFDEACMTPVTSDARDVAEMTRTLIRESKPIVVTWLPGTVLVVDNYRCIHARGAARVPDTDRILLRVLVVDHS